MTPSRPGEYGRSSVMSGMVAVARGRGRGASVGLLGLQVAQPLGYLVEDAGADRWLGLQQRMELPVGQDEEARWLRERRRGGPWAFREQRHLAEHLARADRREVAPVAFHARLAGGDDEGLGPVLALAHEH